MQGVPATLCASIVLVNPIAKLALTMEPVAAATTSAVAARTKGRVFSILDRVPRMGYNKGILRRLLAGAAGMNAQVRRLAVRTGMALACLTAACNVPFLALVMSLIGSLLTIGTAIILPVAIHLKIFQACSSK